jgi:hypothetical protein
VSRVDTGASSCTLPQEFQLVEGAGALGLRPAVPCIFCLPGPAPYCLYAGVFRMHIFGTRQL